jgi:hypothetical protein
MNGWTLILGSILVLVMLGVAGCVAEGAGNTYRAPEKDSRDSRY